MCDRYAPKLITTPNVEDVSVDARKDGVSGCKKRWRHDSPQIANQIM
jgi:hypothetical protein